MKKHFIKPQIIVREVIISNIMSGSGAMEDIPFGGEVTQFECKRSHIWDAMNTNDEN